ncbi:hypothetical protein U3516DRAFT_747004 [Neocallimastix sp. 'constans']
MTRHSTLILVIALSFLNCLFKKIDLNFDLNDLSIRNPSKGDFIKESVLTKLDVKDIKLGKEKKLFYSIEIDLKFNKYGEFCLKRAETEHSYFDENYNEYMNTETFGFLFIYK